MASKLIWSNFLVVILFVFFIAILCGVVMLFLFSKTKKDCPICVCPVNKVVEAVVLPGKTRDNAVLNDPLYPPLNRSANDVPIPPLPRNRNTDSYRLVGYLIDQSDKNDSWKIFAMEKYKGGRSQFYVTPTNKDIDMKVFLTNDIIIGRDKFIDLYSMPDKVSIQHPMFAKGTYDVVQLPMSDFSTNYI